jgi:hypothetical protein
MFSFAVLSGNATCMCTFVARERGEEGEWDEWEGGGRTKKRGPTFPHLPHSSHSPSSPRSRATKVHSHAALPDKTAKENRSQRAL